MNSLRNKMTKWDKILEVIQFVAVGMTIELLALAFFMLA